MKRSVFSSPQAIDPRSNPDKGSCGTATLPHYLLLKIQKNPPKTPNISSNFDLNGLERHFGNRSDSISVRSV